MKAERQQKETISRILQQSKGGGGHVVDNRPQFLYQTQMIEAIQRESDNKIILPEDSRNDTKNYYGYNKIKARECYMSDNLVQLNKNGVLQKSKEHVLNLGCETHEAANDNFKFHMRKYVDDPIELSALRGARYNTVINIEDKELAEEIAAELYLWPAEWMPYQYIYITTIGAYYSETYFDGKLYGKQNCKFKFKCELKNRNDHEKYYQAYHFIGFA